MLLKSKSYFKDQSNFFSKLSTINDNNNHNHEFIEIFYVISGTAYHTLNGVKSKIGLGDLYIIRQTDFHFFTRIEGEDMLHRDLLVRSDIFKSVCDMLSDDFFDKISSARSVHVNIGSNAIAKNENTFTSILYHSYNSPKTTEILYKFLILDILKAYFKSQLSESSKQKQSRQIITLILETLNRPESFSLSAKQILNGLQYDHSYICKLFKAHTGITISEYINNNRLEYAYTLLKSSSLSLQEIAYTVGYQNYSYFYRAFVKRFNSPPKKTQLGMTRTID